MFFFDLFFGKRLAPEAGGSGAAIDPRIEPGAGLMPARQSVSGLQQGADQRRTRRHARREQLYVAVREAMTRSGVLAATYRFKVLSLDQLGNEFLVMVDLSMDFQSITSQLGAMEALIVQNAKARFAITVPTVYWRMDMAQASAPGKPLPAEQLKKPPVHVRVGDVPAALTARPVSAAIRHDPLEADEVAAFRLALLNASAKAPVSALETAAKSRRGVSSYTLLTGFEDTELPESAASAALSKTQYGELR
jgi:hypothetical protein